MNLHRFSQLVEAYGARPENWPSDERQTAIDFLDSSEAAADLIKTGMLLDDQLDGYLLPESDLYSLKKSILASVANKPASEVSAPQIGLLDRLLDWLLPLNPTHYWQPALAATLPLIVGAVLGMNIERVSVDANDSWEDEIQLMSFSSDSVEFPYE